MLVLIVQFKAILREAATILAFLRHDKNLSETQNNIYELPLKIKETCSF